MRLVSAGFIVRKAATRAGTAVSLAAAGVRPFELRTIYPAVFGRHYESAQKIFD